MKNKLDGNAVGILSGLFFQYVLGMTANLFVSFPEDGSEGQEWGFAWSQVPIALHIVLAFLILFGASALLIRTIRAKDRVWRPYAIVGFLAVLAAFVSGAKFVPTQNDAYSYSMAIAFIVAASSYGFGLYKSHTRLS